MKKILSLTLVAIMLLSTLMLTSCDAAIKLVQLYILSSYDTQLFEIRYTVTEEEWNAAINLENYSTEYVTNITGEEVCTFYKFTKDGYRLKSDDKEKFYIFQEGTCYLLEKHGEEYVASEAGYAKDHNVLAFWLHNLSLSDFTYDESSHAYVLTQIGSGYEIKLVVKFEDGVIISMYTTLADETGVMFQNYGIYSVGKTTIDFPPYTMGE